MITDPLLDDGVNKDEDGNMNDWMLEVLHWQCNVIPEMGMRVRVRENPREHKTVHLHLWAEGAGL